ncbi:MAG: DUF3999 domain-containing protein [Treponema sp.]|jgi:hypothetical protein|nr:DUF3999 domain-containing protein [Treponema sp.]
MNVLKKSLVFVFVLIALSGIVSPGFRLYAGEGDAFSPVDFAGTIGLNGKSGAILAWEIPEIVYRRLERPDFGDIRVFDAEGLMVPFAIRKAEAALFTPPPESVPFFIWQGSDADGFPHNQDIELNAEGTVITIRNYRESPASPVYLLDCSIFSEPPASLVLRMKGAGEFFNTLAVIHYSTDLVNWTLFTRKQTLSYYGGSGASRDSLELPLDAFRYLLLSFSLPTPELLSAEARFKAQPRNTPGRDLRVVGERSADKKKVAYTIRGYFPLICADWLLPQPDSIQVTVKNRFKLNEDWNYAGSLTIFQYLGGGSVRKNSPLETSSPAPYWEIEAAGSQSFASVPDMLVNYEIREIVFLARGPGPWKAAYGNSLCPPDSTLDIAGLSVFESAGLTGEETYEPGSRKSRGSKRDYGEFALWSILIIAALLLSFLAFTIAKNIHSSLLRFSAKSYKNSRK